MKKHLMIIGALLAATPAEAQNRVLDNGNEILSMCDDDSNFMAGLCLGYIRGISTATDAFLATDNQFICYPDNVSMGQLRDVVVSYIKRNPSLRHETATLLYMKATTEAWPCK